MGSVGSGTECDVLPEGVGQGSYLPCRLLRSTIGMNSNVIEAASKTRLHKRARCLIERLTGTKVRQEFIGHRRSEAIGRIMIRPAMNPQRFLPGFLLAFGTGRRTGSAGGAGTLNNRLGHAHDLIGHLIGFALIRVTRCADSEFGLHPGSELLP